MTAAWSVVSDTNGGRELTQATDRSFTWKRRDPSTATIKLPGRHEEAGFVIELVTDLTVRRNKRKLLRARVGPTEDNLDENNHDVTITAGDYGALLERRNIIDTDALGPFTADAGTLAINLINLTQARTNGNLGITGGLGVPLGAAYGPFTLTAGKSVAAHLNQLRDAGVFDWEINADLELDIYGGGRAFPTDVVIDYGGAASKIKRAPNTAEYANVGRYSGDDILTPQNLAVADIATREEGRFETIYADRDIHDADTLTDTGNADLARRSLILPAYDVTLRPEWWQGPDHVWPGNIIRLQIRSGRLAVNDDLIVEELTAAPGNDGDETITLRCGWPTNGPLQRLRDTEHGLRDLRRV